MRKIISVVLVLAVFLSSSLYAAEVPTLLGFRSKFFDESRAIKLMLPNSKKDMVFMNSMWDSCIATLMQLDAYFSMAGIFNTIRKEDLTEGAVGYIADWLNAIKNTNEMNIKNLNAFSSRSTEASTKPHLKTMINYYTALNERIDIELAGVSALKATAKKK